ncbi:Rz1-like lysis system protein LysC [Burkholderia glumae]|uniref:Rz1-like lysis system protein LysC n=1 Tax=Burkholderia glumae TaxID=337 RepID=UPI0020373455|nr:Rz1-like lysis system protein LysC [Burkholderia glumae]MCM2540889.1 Rz1-like lysis system protein LysC [Burkholderia glumae]
MLCACQQAPLTPAPKISVQECQRLSPCVLQAQAPRTNGELLSALVTTREAWGKCAAKVDMIVDCQTHAQAKIDAQAKAAGRE